MLTIKLVRVDSDGSYSASKSKAHARKILPMLDLQRSVDDNKTNFSRKFLTKKIMLLKKKTVSTYHANLLCQTIEHNKNTF